MPRTIWSGAISFGLVTVPCHIQSTTEDRSIHFHQYHLEDMGRIRYRKVCELEDREVSDAEIGKGYEYAKGQVVPIRDEDLENLPLPTAKAIEILGFLPWESIDPIQIGEGYYLAPDGQVAAKPYTLLRQALDRAERVGIAKYALRGRERLGLLRVRDEAIVLHVMRWPDEIRDPSELLPPPVDVPEEEIESALALMEMMSRDDLDATAFHDEYTEAIAQVIEAKREDRPLPQTPEPEEPGQVLDLMAALTESVEKARASRGEETQKPERAEPKKAPARKQRAKKTAARKTAARQPRSA
ncbi:Ku protein [Streptomyces sp. NPDC002553]|uniref:non-homologous end joining protein Ku n=1 Tax=Streptomyces sp. NPDC002553 TaxID=3154417 RepID=UPI003331226A